MSDYSAIIEIKSDHANAVESFVHEIIKQADEGSRYGVNIDVTRLQESSDHEVTFE